MENSMPISQKERQAKYYEKNKEAINEKRREKRAEKEKDCKGKGCDEKVKGRREYCKECVKKKEKEWQKKYYEKNKDKKAKNKDE
jgi:hypothetical protein